MFSVIRVGRNDISGALKTGEFLLSHQLSLMILLRYISGYDTMLDCGLTTMFYFSETSMSDSRELLSGQYPP